MSVGVVFYKKVNDIVSSGEKMFTVYSNFDIDDTDAKNMVILKKC